MRVTVCNMIHFPVCSRPIGSTWLLPFAIVGLALAPDQADARAEAAVDSQLSRQTEVSQWPGQKPADLSVLC